MIVLVEKYSLSVTFDLLSVVRKSSQLVVKTKPTNMTAVYIYFFIPFTFPLKLKLNIRTYLISYRCRTTIS